MAGLAGFLSGTVSESLKKIVLPAGVVPATIFTLLNLAFVYPPARAANVGIATQFAGLSSGWQVAVITTVVFVLGYLLVNLAPSAVATLAGDTWRGSALHQLWSWRLARIRQNLGKRANHPHPEDNAMALGMQLASLFALPTSGVEDVPIEPTRLGNVLRATQSELYRRWGIDMTTLWSQLESAASVKDSPAMQTAADEKATLQLLANLIMVAVAFVVEAFTFDALHHRWDAATATLLLLPVAYVCYRIAVAQARSWGDAVQVALDLHHDDLRKSLGLRETISVADMRQLWRKASAFYLPSPLEPDPGDLFEAAPVEGMTATASAGLEVKVLKSDAVSASFPATRRKNWTLACVRYLILVSRSGVADEAPQTTVVISDGRLRALAAPDDQGKGDVTATAKLAEDGSSVIWNLSGLDRGGAIALDYTLPLWTLELSGATAAVRDEGTRGLRLRLTSSTRKKITVTSYLSPAPTPQLYVQNEPRQLRSAARGVFKWSLPAATKVAYLVLPELPL
jgi:hypothetical protein